ncbi:hypothetical protein [Klebsiella pneumoniae]|uniref:hypothetical protein n=1 Tax=Klebsiella pneumoniae TaxID=573 RepID=UPI001E525E42
MEEKQMELTEKQIKDLVARRHPEYIKKKEHWDFLASTYAGGRAWFDDNIFRYFKEGDQEFKERLERAYRFNHTREVVNLINKYLFKEDIHRNVEECLSELKCGESMGLLADPPLSQWVSGGSIARWIVTQNPSLTRRRRMFAPMPTGFLRSRCWIWRGTMTAI